MNSSKKQKVSDKILVDSVTAENQSIPPAIDNEVQLNTLIDEVSGNLTINNLNHDCLAQVLMHLPVLDRLEMEKVCQKWQEATEMSRYNVKKINFNDLIITLDKKEKTWKIILTKYGKYLTHLTIDAKYSWIYDVIKNNCRNIIYFAIYEGTNQNIETSRIVPYESLLEIVTLMPKLKYLKIKIITSNSTEISHNFFTQLMRILPNDIDEIHLIFKDFNDGGDDEYPEISVTPDKFKSIRCLTLQGLRLNHTIKELISLNNKMLVYLDLSGCSLPPYFSIFLNLHDLEYLDLFWIKNLDINVITTIARNCPKLSHLTWSNKNINNHMQAVTYYLRELKNLHNLEYLHIDKIITFNDDESFLFEIAENCKKLKHLDTGFGFSLSTSDLKEVIKFRNLEYLSLCSILDSELLIEIANNCLELKNLIIWLTNVDEIAIEKITNFKKLEIFFISYCDNLTGDLLIKIASTCKNLKHVRIENCSNVTEASLIQVAKLQFLENLVIDDTVNVPIAMFNYLHGLRELSCRDCPSVTDEGIIKVIDNCQNLSRLNLCGTSVTVKTLIHASKRQFLFQNLQILISESDEINRYHRETNESPYLEIDIY